MSQWPGSLGMHAHGMNIGVNACKLRVPKYGVAPSPICDMPLSPNGCHLSRHRALRAGGDVRLQYNHLASLPESFGGLKLGLDDPPLNDFDEVQTKPMVHVHGHVRVHGHARVPLVVVSSCLFWSSHRASTRHASSCRASSRFSCLARAYPHMCACCERSIVTGHVHHIS